MEREEFQAKGLQDIADYFGINAGEMIMIGDEEKDIKTANGSAVCLF